MTDLISRQALRDAMYHETFEKDSDMQKWDSGCWIRYKLFENVVESLPSAEKHVEWIPITTRPMDEEERKEWSEKLGYDIEYEDAVIYDSQLPDDGQEVLVCSMYGRMFVDKFENDPDYGCSFEENGDMDGIVAWMPLPEPYREDAAE